MTINNNAKPEIIVRILLADDHRMFSQLLAGVLNTQKDLEVVGTARTSMHTVELALELRPEIILMDISFPDFDGILATKKILKKQPDTRIIAMLMYSRPVDFQKMMQAGAVGYLTKDCGIDELMRAIQTVKKGSTYITPSLTSVLFDSYVRKGKGPNNHRLTKREREVLKCIADGIKTQKIAHILEVSPKTIETHRRQIMRKLDIDNIALLTKYAIREGLTAL